MHKLKAYIFFRRIFAITIDYLLWSIVIIPTIIYEEEIYTDNYPYSIVCYFMTYTIFIVYLVFSQVIFGKTIGDHIAKIKVIKENGNDLDLKTAFLRNIPITVIFLIERGFHFKDASFGFNPNYISYNGFFYIFFDVLGNLFIVTNAYAMITHEKYKGLHDNLEYTNMIKFPLQEKDIISESISMS